ncbi:unnamed protein product [Sphenostylis stenocarpa]|uniref:Uncharacterized protein n=1 Tax=Sphenostylis stenocarpa TaxID=92480 RepID=A0AA86SB86_9FABA|nr:unnamed protein product [Sphenostylis stenocarpa]
MERRIRCNPRREGGVPCVDLTNVVGKWVIFPWDVYESRNIQGMKPFSGPEVDWFGCIEIKVGINDVFPDFLTNDVLPMPNLLLSGCSVNQ